MAPAHWRDRRKVATTRRWHPRRVDASPQGAGAPRREDADEEEEEAVLVERVVQRFKKKKI